MFKKRKTLEEVINLWLNHNRIHLKGGSLTKYQNMIEMHIIPDLGSLRLSQLNSTKINSYLNQKMEYGRLDGRGALSSSYVNSLRILINSIINFAVEEQMMPPLKSQIHRPCSEKKEPETLSKDEQSKLESYLAQNISPTELGILLSLHTGLRIGEVCALSWNDIDIEDGIIYVRHTISRIRDEDSAATAKTKLILDSPKTKTSKREIPISSRLLPYIQQVQKNCSSSYVISNHPCFLSPRTYEYRYHKILEKCDIHPINYHALRHTFATRCIEAGVDVKTLSEILGHANVGITLNTYVHSSMELKRMQLEKVAGVFAQKI